MRSVNTLEKAARLRDVMREEGVTQKQLAMCSGYSAVQISRLCTGKCELEEYAAEQFAQVLDVRRDWLLCRDDYKTDEDFATAGTIARIRKILSDEIEDARRFGLGRFTRCVFEGMRCQARVEDRSIILTYNTGDGKKETCCQVDDVEQFAQEAFDYIDYLMHKKLIKE